MSTSDRTHSPNEDALKQNAELLALTKAQSVRICELEKQVGALTFQLTQKLSQ
jgi:hypothetical protein